MRESTQFSLLADRRFVPLFVTQFLGAFHDNLFKNALVVFLLFGAVSHAGPNAKILTTLAAGLFILPFVLFSAPGGQLADKFPKDRIIRIVKLAEILIALMGAISFLMPSVPLMFATLFALGTHSAFFGPSKYSILPQHLAQHELIGGNALLNTGAFLAILAGTIVGTSTITLEGGAILTSILLLLCAVTGYVSSRFIPPAPPPAPGMKLDLNPLREIRDVMSYTFSLPGGIVPAIFGVGWFYFMGGMFMAQLPNFVHETLASDERTLTILLVLFSVGIAAGGLFNNRLLRGRIEATYAPAAALGITLFSLDLYLASGGTPGHLPVRVAFDMAMIAICGGLFVVPLNTIVQDRTPADRRARVMAGSAFVNALFVVGSSVLSAVLIGAGLDIRSLFFVFAAANAFVAVFLCRMLPGDSLRRLVQAVRGLF